MGNDILPIYLPNHSRLSLPPACKLYSMLPINSFVEEQQMIKILTKRSILKECPFICTVKAYDFVNVQSNHIVCSVSKQLIVFYDNFDYRLIDLPIKTYSTQFSQKQICNFIHSMVQAIYFLKVHQLHHGDISLQNICKTAKTWRLLDKMFIRNGINAYQKVLQGQSGFISPKQMIRIRHGYIKQSPNLQQADDIFSLGMVVLQLASRAPSSLCYKQLNVRFNEEILNQNLAIAQKIYSKDFSELLKSMISLEQDDRIKLLQLKMHPLIKQASLNNCTIFGQETTHRDNSFNTANNKVKSTPTMIRNNSSDKKKPHTPKTTAYITHQTTKQCIVSPKLPTNRSNLSLNKLYTPPPPIIGNTSPYQPNLIGHRIQYQPSNLDLTYNNYPFIKRIDTPMQRYNTIL